MSSWAHLCGKAPAAQNSSDETSQWWRTVGDAVSYLPGQGIEPHTAFTDSNVLKHFTIFRIVSGQLAEWFNTSLSVRPRRWAAKVGAAIRFDEIAPV